MTADGNNSVYYSSRPTVMVDGQSRPELTDPLLYSLVVEETTLGLFCAEARFSNWDARNGKADFLFFDRDIFDFGKAIAFGMGPPGATRTVFSGRITALEAQFAASSSPEITVLAEDRLLDLRMQRRTRSWENISDADVVRQIGGDNGLTCNIDLDGPTYHVLAQVNQSDLAFLRERMAAIDGELWVEERTLNAVLHKNRNGGAVSLTYGSDLLEFTVMADLAHQRSSVKVSGWDVAGKSAIDEEASAADISGELNGGIGGSDLLGSALSVRNQRIVNAVPLAEDEGHATAVARYRRIARRFVRGSGVTDGTAALRVGAIADLQGLGKLFSGKYYVTRCRHSFDLVHGYRTTFDVERPAIGR